MVTAPPHRNRPASPRGRSWARLARGRQAGAGTWGPAGPVAPPRRAGRRTTALPWRRWDSAAAGPRRAGPDTGAPPRQLLAGPRAAPPGRPRPGRTAVPRPGRTG